MISFLSQQDYLSEEVLARERERLFGCLWIFAALKQLLIQPNAFATRKIGGVPVLLQNCGGVIKAFENQCLHRQMPLQWEEYGRRNLVCRYHGWSYDDEGRPKHIPGREEIYRYSPEEHADFRLREFAVEIVGNLVFVNLNEHPRPISDQFSEELLERLAAISASFDHEVIHTRIAARYNWKLNFENVLDGNHVRYLHPRTFMPYMRAELQPAGEPAPVLPRIDLRDIENCDLRDLSFESKAQFDVPKRPWHDSVERFGSDEIYYNFFLYPNVNFISVAGRIFLIQQFNPVAPDETEIGFSLMTARRLKRIPAASALLWAHLCGEKTVLDEDIVALEALQASLHGKGRRANHGTYEKQLLMNHAVYRRLMGEVGQ